LRRNWKTIFLKESLRGYNRKKKQAMEPFISTICMLGVGVVSHFIKNTSSDVSNVGLGAVGSMIATRTDTIMKSVSERLQRGGEPLNHDLQKAVRRAYLEATLYLSDTCKDFVYSSKEINILDILCKKLNKDINKLSKAEYIPPNAAALRETELLLHPGDVTPAERLKEFQDKLKKSVVSEIMRWHKDEGWKQRFPYKLKEMIEARWFDFMSLYFAEILKTDQKVQAIFQSGLLTDVSFRLESFTEAFENFGKTALEGIHRIDETTRETQKDVKAVRQILEKFHEEKQPEPPCNSDPSPELCPYLLVILKPDSDNVNKDKGKLYSVQIFFWKNINAIDTWYNDSEPPLPLHNIPELLNDILVKDYNNNRVPRKRAEVPKTIEFFLPFELISCDVDQWLIKKGYFKNKVGKEYHVVVRSFERLEETLNPIVHEKWTTRWEQFQQSNDTYNSVFWICEPDEYKAEKLCNDLECKECITCMMMAFQPSDENQFLYAILDIGIPVALWFRKYTDCNLKYQEIKNKIESVISGKNLNELPGVIKDTRKEISGTAIANNYRKYESSLSVVSLCLFSYSFAI